MVDLHCGQPDWRELIQTDVLTSTVAGSLISKTISNHCHLWFSSAGTVFGHLSELEIELDLLQRTLDITSDLPWSDGEQQTSCINMKIKSELFA